MVCTRFLVLALLAACWIAAAATASVPPFVLGATAAAALARTVYKVYQGTIALDGGDACKAAADQLAHEVNEANEALRSVYNAADAMLEGMQGHGAAVAQE